MGSEHFSEEELSCHHCGECIISDRLLELLEQLRYNAGGLPLEISSGYRCEIHNREVGGAENSQHVKGTAVDILCPDHLTMGEFLWYVQQLPFDGVGYYYRDEYSGWIHVDVRDGGVDGGYYWEG